MGRKLQLIMLQGLPASGKSTLAKKMAEEYGFRVVSKDAIREVLASQGWKWSHEGEKRDVLPIRNANIEEALAQGISVISDDTNFAPEHEKVLEKLARRYNAEFVKMVVPCDVDECVKRDSGRGKKKVGEKVIKQMAAKYLGYRDFQPVTQADRECPKDGTPLPPAIICDLDGTAALHNGRGPYEYFKCPTDVPEPVVRDILELFSKYKFYQILYLSGREAKDNVRELTAKWLADNGFPVGPLWMRAAGDMRKDRVVKAELFEANVRGYYDVKFVLDDRNQVVQLWREMGLKCLQVADGDF